MRKLKGVKTSKVPKRFIVVTTEESRTETAKPERLAFYKVSRAHACFVDWSSPQKIERRSFESLDKFWEFTKSKLPKAGRLWVFIEHFQSKFTTLGLTELLERNDIQLWRAQVLATEKVKGESEFKGYISFTPGAAMLRGMMEGRVVEIVDLFNYFDGQATAVDDEIDRWLRGMPEEERAQVGENNAEVRALFWTKTLTEVFKMWGEEDLGWWQATASRLAKNAFQRYLEKTKKGPKRPRGNKTSAESTPRNKRRATPAPEIFIHKNPVAKALERDAYFGGEARAFFRGTWKDKWYYVDVRSMYPFICMTKKLPCQLVKVVDTMNPEAFAMDDDSLGYAACVFLEGAEENAPVRVRKTSHSVNTVDDTLTYEHEVIYPRGNFMTCLCGEELKAAARAGIIKKVYTTAVYLMDYVLKGFMEEWYEKRLRYEEAGNENGVKMTKLVMNSLVGKFGQRGSRWESAPWIIPPILWGDFYYRAWETGRTEYCRSLGGHVQRQVEGREIENSFVAIPAFVCAAGRVLMRGVRAGMPERSVLMQDTDGMIVTEAGLRALESRPDWNKKEPGGLRVKMQGDRCTIFSPRQMILDARLVTAGLPISGSIVQGGDVQFEVGLPVLRQITPDCKTQAVTRVYVTRNMFQRPTGPRNAHEWLPPRTLHEVETTHSPYPTRPVDNHSQQPPA